MCFLFPNIMFCSRAPIWCLRTIEVSDPLYIAPFYCKEPLLFLNSEQTFNCTQRNIIELYKCEFCDFTAFLKVNFKIHKDLYHRSRDKKLSVENYLTIAENNYNVTNILKCYICVRCEFTTHSLLLFTKHQNRKHALQAPKIRVNCKNSSKTISSKYENSKFKCNQCDFKTRNVSSLKKHKNFHVFPDECEIFVCKECSFKTPIERGLRRHVRRHVEKDSDVWFLCEDCSYKTKHKDYLERHVKGSHTAPENLNWAHCEYCTYKAKKKWILKDHILARHTAPEDINWFLCEICGFKCKFRRGLMQHLRLKHKLN